MKSCSCNTKSFLHLSTCDSLDIKEKIPLSFIHMEAILNPGSVIFYVTALDDSIDLINLFKSSLNEEWLYQLIEGNVSTITLKNGTDITFLPETEAEFLRELPNSSCIFFELTTHNHELAENLIPNTNKIIIVDPITKDLV